MMRPVRDVGSGPSRDSATQNVARYCRTSRSGCQVMLAVDDEYTSTPAVSHAILTYNRGRVRGLADGIVMTPSHNPPRDGGFKYNATNGGPAEPAITRWIEDKANDLLAHELRGVARIAADAALRRGVARWKHGAYSQDARDLRAEVRENRESFRTLVARGKELGLW